MSLMVLVAAVAAGCGGGDDLTGKAEVPQGYATFTGAGVSFAYPQGWKVSRETGPDGSLTVQILAPGVTQAPGPLIQLMTTPGGGKRFDSMLDQLRVVIEKVNDGKIDSQDEVKVEGAVRAVRRRTTTPAGEGTARTDVASTAIDVITKAGDVVGLSAATPVGDDPELDPEVVIDSFRLQG